MEEVKKAVLYTSARRLSYIISFTLFVASVPVAFIESKLNGSAWLYLVWIFASLVSRPFLQRFLNARNPDNVFFGSKVFKKLEELGYADEFVNTIDEEMKNDIIVKTCEDKNQHNLFITKTWFIHITSNKSIIRKISDISGISRVLRSNSRHAAFVEFKDGSSFLSEYFCDEIIRIFKKRFPDLLKESSEK